MKLQYGFYAIFALSCLRRVVYAEVLTLTKDHKITCIVTSDTPFRIYATNSTDEILFDRSEFNEWHQSDWLLRNGTEQEYLITQNDPIPCEDENCFDRQIYQFSYNVSSSSSYVNVSSSCVSMSVLVDWNCFLNITLESQNGDLQFEIVNSTTNRNSGYILWKKIKIETSDGKAKGLYFQRGRYDHKKEGYWAIDKIRKCEELEIVSKEMDTDDLSQYICKTDSLFDEPLHLSRTPPRISECCNITCSSILGHEFSNCENHRICLGKDCHCAWGYEGPNCNTTCREGFFGLDCQQLCTAECEKCDHISGCKKCKTMSVGLNCSERLPVVVSPPTLIKMVNDTTVTLQVNLEYGRQEATPEFYLLQCKENNAAMFQNCYQQQKYPGKVKQEVEVNISRIYSNEIRVVLICQNQSVENGIPTLKIDEYNRNSSLINNCSAYSRDNDAVSVKFNISSGDYEIVILDEERREFPNSNKTKTCTLWSHFLCVDITNNKELFNITIKIKSRNASDWGEERTFTITAKTESSAPENPQIRFSPNSSYFEIFWERPLYTYGQVDKFMVEIKNDSVGKTNVPVHKQNYTSEMIPLSSCKNCTITVFVENGQKSLIRAFTSKLKRKVSNLVAILWCSKSCFLLLPNVDDDVEVNVMNNVTKEIDSSLHGQGFKYNLGDIGDSVLSGHQFLEIEYKGNLYPVDFSNFEVGEVKTDSKGFNYALPAIIIMIVLLAIAVVVWAVWYKWYRCKPKTPSQNGEAHELPLFTTSSQNDVSSTQHHETDPSRID